MNTPIISKKIFIGAVVAILLILGLVFPRGNTVVERMVTEFAGSAGPSHLVTQQFLAGTMGYSVPVISTTTVICRLRNPLQATTTYSSRLKITTSTTTATVFMLSTTTDIVKGFATTGPATMMSRPIGANNQITASYNGTDNNNVLGPSDWVYWGYAAGTNPTEATVAGQHAGICDFDFKAIQ